MNIVRGGLGDNSVRYSPLHQNDFEATEIDIDNNDAFDYSGIKSPPMIGIHVASKFWKVCLPQITFELETMVKASYVWYI